MQQFHLFMSIYECCICDIAVHYFQVAHVFFRKKCNTTGGRKRTRLSANDIQVDTTWRVYGKFPRLSKSLLQSLTPMRAELTPFRTWHCQSIARLIPQDFVPLRFGRHWFSTELKLLSCQRYKGNREKLEVGARLKFFTIESVVFISDNVLAVWYTNDVYTSTVLLFRVSFFVLLTWIMSALYCS